MLDWWQALLYVVAVGLITLAASYLTHRWTTSANREAEERQAKRRLQEEQRQAIRHFRRERIQPVLDWLDIAKQSAGRETVSRTLDAYSETLSAGDKASPERLEAMKAWLSKIYPDAVQETRAISIAMWAGMSIAGLPEELMKTFAALRLESDPQQMDQLGPALESAERLIEQHLAGAEPKEQGTGESAGASGQTP